MVTQFWLIIIASEYRIINLILLNQLINFHCFIVYGVFFKVIILLFQMKYKGNCNFQSPK